MPALEQTIIDGITTRLERYLKYQSSDYGKPTYVSEGGSAAIYKIDFQNSTRVFKVLNPSFLDGLRGDAERHRLEVQRRLIKHNCSQLVQIYRVDEKEDTAIIEMEFVPWAQLTKKLAEIPDDAVSSLIMQLVEAIRFLESRNIVHRDIKPDNIHISPDFQHIKLLDLGVAREISYEETNDVAITDHGNHKLFLATAQYSSPEYLFRLDEPSVNLWKGLNYYQIGAVLHDLIMKTPLFQEEVNLGNRWLVARAVLTKTPSFFDKNPNRLVALKALAARCLVKDLEARLQLVGWQDFDLEVASNPLAKLRERLTKNNANSGENTQTSMKARLEFERSKFVRQFIDSIRNELTSVCETKLPFKLVSPASNTSQIYELEFSTSADVITIECLLRVNWGEELYCRTATIDLSAQLLLFDSQLKDISTLLNKTICSAVIDEAMDEAIFNTCANLATTISHGLDLIDSAGGNYQPLDGMDLLTKIQEPMHE